MVIHWLKSRSSRFIPFVATRIQEFQDSHNDVKQELRYVPSAFSPADMLTKPIVVEGLQTWYEGSDFRKLPESSWPENNDIPEPDSVLLETQTQGQELSQDEKSAGSPSRYSRRTGFWFTTDKNLRIVE